MASDELSGQIVSLQEKIKSASLPADLQEKVLERLARIARIGATPLAFDEFDRTAEYIDWLLGLPWSKKSEDVLDLTHTKTVLDKNHYGLGEIKDNN